MTLHNTVRKIDCKSLLHTAFSYFLPIDKPLPIFCKGKIHSKSPHYVSFLILRALLCHCWISPEIPLPPSNFAPLGRFGNSFVSDVDRIAYNNENRQEFFYFSFSPEVYSVLFPRQIILSACVCVCAHVTKTTTMLINYSIWKPFSVFELLLNNIFYLDVTLLHWLCNFPK